MFNTLFYPTTMNRKEYLIAQGNVQKDVSALAETLKTQLAVFPEAISLRTQIHHTHQKITRWLNHSKRNPLQ